MTDRRQKREVGGANEKLAVLRDVSTTAREVGFRCPVAVSAEAWGACVSGPGETARVRALLDLLRHSLIPLDGWSEEVEFAVEVLNDDRPGEPLVRLAVACGRRDDGEPAITVMLDHEQRHEDGGGEATPERLSRCPLCGGEIRATVERYYSLCGGAWVETGGGTEVYCENDCDLPESSGRIPELG